MLSLAVERKKTEKLIVVGDGEFAEIAYEYFTYDSPYTVVAFAVEKPFLKKKSLFGLPVIEFERIQDLYKPSEFRAFVAVTSTQLNRVRTRLYNEVKRKGYSLVSYVSSKAFVWRNVVMGENCFVFENNVLQYCVKMGNNVVLWSGNHVGHRTTIGDNCFVSSHVVISGFCEIGENCFMGVNSCVRDFVRVAKDCLIGAGAVVVKDTEAGKVYIGNPAKATEKTSFVTFNVKETER